MLLAGRGPCSQLHAGVTAQTKHILYEPTCLGTSISQRRLSECIARMAPPHREQAGVVSSGGVSPWCDGCTKEPAKMPRFPSKPAPSLVCAVFIPLPSAQVSLTHPRIKQKNCGEKKKKAGTLETMDLLHSRFVGQSRSENQECGLQREEKSCENCCGFPGVCSSSRCRACSPPRCSSGAGSELNNLPLNIKYI